MRAQVFAVRRILTSLLFVALTVLTVRAQNVSIGTATANNSALLHLESTSKGFLMPRMTDAQMWAISSPYTSDIVFNTTYNTFYYWNGTVWTPFLGQGWSITGDAGTSASTNFLGTKDSVDLVQKTNSKEHFRVFAAGDAGLRNTNNSANSLMFYEPSGSGSLFTAFKAGVQTATVHYTWPVADGTPNQTLVTNGAGTLSWHTFATFGGGGSTPLWERGNGTYGEDALGSGNGSGGKYSISGDLNDNAQGKGSVAWGTNNSVSSGEGTISGGDNNSNTSTYADIQGGRYNQVKGQGGHIGGGLFNQSSGAHATTICGDSNNISGAETVVINGHNNSGASQDNLMFGANINVTGGNQLIFMPPTPPECRLGMNTAAPTQAADIVGNIKFSGALSANGSTGTLGQYLTSAGSGTSPTWAALTVPTTNWKLLGNSGTSPSTNFIGTGDAVDFAIRTSNTERARITSAGLVGIGTSSPTQTLHSVYGGTTDETAAIFGRASGASATNQMVGIWGRANGNNTGTIGVLATGNRNTTAGNTNVALQISSGEFTMGRTTETPSAGTNVGAASSGSAYTQQGPSGAIQLSLGNDLPTVTPTAGVMQDLGTFTINNRYLSASSIIMINVIDKIDGGAAPNATDEVFKVNVRSRTSGACVVHVAMLPTVTSASNFQGSDYIVIGYTVINPGR